MSQVIWHFGVPVIRWCAVHETIEFSYDNARGLVCRGNAGSEQDCDEQCWVDFSAEDEDALEAANVYAQAYNSYAHCKTCGDHVRLAELDDDGKCLDNKDCGPPEAGGECPDCGSTTPPPDGEMYGRCPDCVADDDDLPVDHPSGLGYVGDYDEEQACDVCGCTDSQACPGGCCWETETVCCAHSRGAEPCPRCGCQTPLSGQAALDAGHTTDMTFESPPIKDMAGPIRRPAVQAQGEPVIISDTDPAQDLEQQASTLIKALGYRIARGPYLNRNRTKHGVYIFSIKTVLSAADLKKMEIKPQKDAPADMQRTVRFVAAIDGAQVVSLERISATARKKSTLGAMSPATRRKVHQDNSRKKRKKA